MEDFAAAGVLPENIENRRVVFNRKMDRI